MMPYQAWLPDMDDRQSMRLVQALTALGYAFDLEVTQRVSRVRLSREGTAVSESADQSWRHALIRACAKIGATHRAR